MTKAALIHFNVWGWLVQFGLHGGRWSVETFRLEYEGEPGHYHRIIYFGPLCLSWEAILKN